MTVTVASLWRHPIKAHGREGVTRLDLKAGQTVPWDRVWAIAHEASKADGATWVPCANFSRGAKAPALMAVTCTLDEDTATVTLCHPDRPDLTVAPDDAEDAARLIDWVRPLMPEGRAASARVVRAQERGMTDSDFPSVALCNLASHRAVEQQLGKPLSIHRWRGNIWLDGLAPWEEFDLVGQDIRIGDAVLRVRERTGRCKATTANPETGVIDADTLGALKTWGHTDFAIYAEVIADGEVATGDAMARA
ncbi:MOSC domain-containing protein [Citreimonas sp.]|uniref:MOSC domain-containing protein n=1 Tax=Citreimonas sp. TaxID=3036715 RepID=UPI0040597F86